MITVNIGRTFLKAYNKKYKKELTAKEFFEQEYFELFFNYPKYLQWPTNSPFVQMKKGQKPHSLTTEDRKDKLQDLHVKITAGERDASIAIGFPASEAKEYATTSGLITDMNLDFQEDEIYLSWIGSGLSVGVTGGLSILFDQSDILLKTYEGWKVYRKFLNDPTLEKLAGNKITSWNGQWLSYAFSKNYRESFDFASMDNLNFFKLDNDKTTVVIDTVKWSKLFFNLSRQFPKDTYTGYVFSFGQMNKTFGFLPFKFQQAQKPIFLYKKLFGENAAIHDATVYEELFGLKFHQACKLGAIGLQALQPEKLFEDIAKDRKLDLIKYKTYKIWLLAMINKEDTFQLTSEIAEILHLFEKGSKGTDRKNLIENKILQSAKRLFLKHWEEVVKQTLPEEKLKLKEISDKIFFMTNEEFGYFIVLLKLDYRYQEK